MAFARLAPFGFSIMLFISAFPWVILTWLRTRRYTRYFQLEGYDTKRYLRWLWRNQAERRQLTIGFVALAAGLIYLLLLSNLTLLLPVVANVVLVIVMAITAPRDEQVKQQFTPTQRAVRLIVTTVLVKVWPLAVAVIAFVIGPNLGDDFVSHLFLWFVAWAAVSAGVFAYFTLPFALPLANLINFPLEEAFRRYYLGQAKRFLKRSGATVIAITGSYGKTSTKHYLHHILDGRFRVLMTPKSYNTLLGISRVINDVLAKNISYEYFIVETDAYFVGENARICKLVEPQIGMVMTVGPMHLERLGSMANIATAQYEVIQALPPNGAGFFNGDDPAVREMAGRGYPQTTGFVTKSGVVGARLEALNVQMTAEGIDFEVRDNQTNEQRAMHTPLYGDHNVTNILMAAIVARHLGMSLAEIAMRVTTLQPAEHRLIRRVMTDGTILIDDSYSANPVGTQTALDVLALHAQSQHRVVVSSGMFELGAVSNIENHKLGERMAAAATHVILIGVAQTRSVKAGLEGCAFPPDHVYVVSSLTEAVNVYRGILQPGDTLLMLTDLPDLYA